MIYTMLIPGKPVPKETMTAALVKKARSYRYVAKSVAEARRIQRINDCLAYQEFVAWCTKSFLNKNSPIAGYVKITAKIYLKPNKNGDLPNERGDLDNYLKSIVDGLQYGGLFAPKPGCKKGNDKMVIRYGQGTGIYTDDNERVELLLEQIKI